MILYILSNFFRNDFGKFYTTLHPSNLTSSMNQLSCKTNNKANATVSPTGHLRKLITVHLVASVASGPCQKWSLICTDSTMIPNGLRRDHDCY